MFQAELDALAASLEGVFVKESSVTEERKLDKENEVRHGLQLS